MSSVSLCQMTHRACRRINMLKVNLSEVSVLLAGIYVVEDVSETYIEKPFLDKGSFTEFMKNAIDIVQCR